MIKASAEKTSEDIRGGDIDYNKCPMKLYEHIFVFIIFIVGYFSLKYSVFVDESMSASNTTTLSSSSSANALPKLSRVAINFSLSILYLSFLNVQYQNVIIF